MEPMTFWDQIVASKTVIWMFVAFVLFVGFAFRPGAGRSQKDSANSIFRNEDRPLTDGAATKEEARQ